MSEIKELVGRYASRFVQDGMIVGLGTGSTAFYFIDELGLRIKQGDLPNISCVSTSKQSLELAKEREIPCVPIDRVDRIDVLVDGADEATLAFQGVKGGGGALLYEKIVASIANHIIWIITEDKLVDQLGAFPLPVEIVRFGSWNLFRRFQEAGLNPSFRKAGEDSLFVTDAGNYIIDLDLGKIDHPAQLAQDLISMVGVVEHGLFLDFADDILIGKSDGTVQVLQKAGD